MSQTGVIRQSLESAIENTADCGCTAANIRAAQSSLTDSDDCIGVLQIMQAVIESP